MGIRTAMKYCASLQAARLLRATISDEGARWYDYANHEELPKLSWSMGQYRPQTYDRLQKCDYGRFTLSFLDCDGMAETINDGRALLLSIGRCWASAVTAYIKYDYKLRRGGVINWLMKRAGSRIPWPSRLKNRRRARFTHFWQKAYFERSRVDWRR